MSNPTDKESTSASDQTTPIDPEDRQTGSGGQGETRPGASPEEPGGGSQKQAGDPNQGTEAR